jgi:hypothetical protein
MTSTAHGLFLAFFQTQRTSAGDDLILEKNLFIEYLLRNVARDAMEIYRRLTAFLGPPASRCFHGRAISRLPENRKMWSAPLTRMLSGSRRRRSASSKPFPEL